MCTHSDNSDYCGDGSGTYVYTKVQLSFYSIRIYHTTAQQTSCSRIYSWMKGNAIENPKPSLV